MGHENASCRDTFLWAKTQSSDQRRGHVAVDVPEKTPMFFGRRWKDRLFDSVQNEAGRERRIEEQR